MTEVLAKRSQVAVVIAMAAVLAFSTDLYLPSAPSMREAFATTDQGVQLTFSAFMLGTAVSHFFFGLFSDRFGRRLPTLGGLTIYFGATLGILAAPTIEIVIGLRFIQGAGAAVGGVLGVLILRDLFEERAAVRWAGHRSSAVTLSFILAPLLGGWLQITFGWRASFNLMAIFACALLVAAWMFLHETHRDMDPGALGVRRVWSNLTGLLTDRKFLGYLLVPPLMFGGFGAFLVSAPFLYIRRLGLSPELFGGVLVLNSLSFLVGIQAAKPINSRYGLDRTILIGAFVGLAGTASMFALAMAGLFSIAAITGPIALLMFGTGMVSPNATIRGVNRQPRVAGLSSAIMGTSLFGASSFFAWFIGLFPSVNAGPLSAVVFGTSVAALAVAASTIGFARESGR